MMRGKKYFLAKALSVTGILGVLRRHSSSTLLALNYHRIRENDNDSSMFDDGVFLPNVAQFEDHLRWLKENTTVLSEERLLEILATGLSPKGVSSLITFDDGYVDNFTLAGPVLRRHGLTATFFIPTDLVASRRLGWWDIISYLIKSSRRGSIEIMGNRYDLPSQAREAIRRCLGSVKNNEFDSADGFVADLSKECGVDTPDVSVQSEQLMTWDHVRELSASGHSIGSHTKSHKILSGMTSDEQRSELEDSKRILEGEIGKEVKSISWPVGGYEHITNETKGLAKACGYKLGYSFNTGVNDFSSVDHFDIRRIAPPNEIEMLAATTFLPSVFWRR